MSTVVLMVLKWMAAHPAEVVMAFGAVCSLCTDWMAKRGWTMPARLTAVATKLGVDLPGLKDALTKELPVAVNAVEKAVEKK